MEKPNTIEAYLQTLSSERLEAINKLRKIFTRYLPKGFKEEFSYGMIGYVVPHSLYSSGYHCNPALPLPFINIASQKNFIAVYHMGIYAKPSVLEWFVYEYPKNTTQKLDMGKSCIRFKKVDAIPYKLFEELATKFTVNEWISCYESAFRSSKSN